MNVTLTFTGRTPASITRRSAAIDERARYRPTEALILRDPTDAYRPLVVATDGKCAAISRVEALMDDDTPNRFKVPCDALPTNPGASRGSAITCNGDGNWRRGKAVVAPTPGEDFPDVAAVMPDLDSADYADSPGITLNADILRALADALTSDGVVTLFPGRPNRAIAVVGYGHEGVAGAGVIMPCQTNRCVRGDYARVVGDLARLAQTTR